MHLLAVNKVQSCPFKFSAPFFSDDIYYDMM